MKAGQQMPLLSGIVCDIVSIWLRVLLRNLITLGQLVFLLCKIPQTDKREMGLLSVWRTGGRSKLHSFQFHVRLSGRMIHSHNYEVSCFLVLGLLNQC